MKWENEIARYLLNIFWGKLWVAKREKETPPVIKKSSPLHFKKGWVGWEEQRIEDHSGTFASDEPEKVLPFDEGLLKGRRFSFRLPIFNF